MYEQQLYLKSFFSWAQKDANGDRTN